MSLFQIILSSFLIYKTREAVTGHTCAYTDNQYHPTQASECTYQASDDGICFFVKTSSGQTYCAVSPGVTKEDTLNSYANQKSSLGVDEIVGPEPSLIPNNCGLVGILEPLSEENCTAITIPEAHCCFVTINYENNGKSQSHVCRRLKKKPKKNNDVSEVEDSLKNLGATPTEVVCMGCFVKSFLYFFVLILIF